MASKEFSTIIITDVGTIKVTPGDNYAGIQEISIRERQNGEVTVGGTTRTTEGRSSISHSRPFSQLHELIPEVMTHLSKKDPPIKPQGTEVIQNGHTSYRVPFEDASGQVVYVAIGSVSTDEIGIASFESMVIDTLRLWDQEADFIDNDERG